MYRICAGIEAQATAIGYDAIVLLMSFNINTSPATRKLKIVPPLMKVLENRGVK